MDDLGVQLENTPKLGAKDTKSYRNKAPAPTEAARPIADEEMFENLGEVVSLRPWLVSVGFIGLWFRVRPVRPSEDVLAEEVRCREEPDGNDAARYQELSHTYRFANTGARPTAA